MRSIFRVVLARAGIPSVVVAVAVDVDVAVAVAVDTVMGPFVLSLAASGILA